MKFKIGMRVIKARPYSEEKYCLHGGEAQDVPIGSKGTVFQNNLDIVMVQFDKGNTWNLHFSELDVCRSRYENVAKIITK